MRLCSLLRAVSTESTCLSTAGVTVAAVTSVLALAGVLGLLVRNRRAAAAQAASDDRLPTTGDGDGGESRRRRVR